MRQKMQAIRQLVCLCVCVCFAGQLLGCEAFVRKFTRKHKKDPFLAQEELVLVPQEYKTTGLSHGELYQQYLLFWKSWQDELIESLRAGANQKKRVSCSKELIKNAEQMQKLLQDDAAKRLQAHIDNMVALQEAVVGDRYGNLVSSHRATAERIKRNFLRDFSYRKVKDSLRAP